MPQSCSISGFATQADKIEALLRSRYDQWIPAYELSDLALQYCARINSIRKKLRAAGDSEEIENKTERVNGQCHGSYRIRQKPLDEWRARLRKLTEQGAQPQPAPEFELTP